MEMKLIEALSAAEKEEVKLELKKTRDVNQYQRLLCVLNYDRGLNVSEISRVSFILERSVYEYLQSWANERKTKNDPRGGSSEKLTAENSIELEQHLKENTYLSCRAIVRYVRKTFGVKYSVNGMHLWLKSHKFKYKKPATIPGKLDPLKQKEFIEQYHRLKENLSADERIYFMDGVHPAHQAQAVGGWIFHSEKKHLPTSGKQTRLHFMGAVNTADHHIVTRSYETIDQSSVLDFFHHLERSVEAKKIYLILDNAAVHKAAKKALINSKVELIYLPPYSPNLNPIERYWKLMRKKTIYNRSYEKFADFSTEVHHFFKSYKKYKTEIASLITDNFQTFTPNFLHLSTG